MVAALTGEDKTKWCGKKCITYKIPPQFMKHEIVGQNNKLCVTLISILNVTRGGATGGGGQGGRPPPLKVSKKEKN